MIRLRMEYRRQNPSVVRCKLAVVVPEHNHLVVDANVLPVHFGSYTAVAVSAEMTLADVMQLGSDLCVLVRLVH